ncbi:MAG TPA: serine hydrolase domain-containing protein [Candidatus Binatia bacterium]|jgi:CubicO group peptidase (beta-lactamase class C family)|nr:serine hydrolase domain-containing protein [Candidatus Binatia bacterium]
MNPRELGFDSARLDHLADVIRADIAAERYDGCELVVGRGGRVAFHEQFGFADRASGRPVAPAQPFITMSIAKQLTVVLVLRAIERGHFGLTTRVADVIPEFAARGKGRVTVTHLLTHTGGLPAMLPPMPPELVGNLAAVVEATSACLLESRPGTHVVYSVLVAHAILAEMVRRTDGGGRPYRQVLREELFEPLGMHDTWLGLPPAVASRIAPVVARDRRAGMFDPTFLEAMGGILGEDTEIPAGGAVSTAPDMHRFADMLRGGGTLDGVRILSPATVELLTVNQTGDEPNTLFAYTEDMRGWDPIPANLGLGFFLRGEGLHPTPFGQLASPSTFGGFGAGSSVFWIDPERDLTYAFLSSGLMEDSYSIERHQKLSDLVHAAVIA